MCQSLASGRFRCTGAVGSVEAFAISKKEGVDVALLDVSGLRAADGLKLARRLRDEIEDLGVVMVADTRSLEDLVDALRVGVVDYLAKPLAAGELADAVRRAVEWRSTIQLSRGALGRHEQEMALGATRIAEVLAEAGIASSVALDEYLSKLYGQNVAAFEHTRRVASAAVLVATNMRIEEPLARTHRARGAAARCREAGDPERDHAQDLAARGSRACPDPIARPNRGRHRLAHPVSGPDGGHSHRDA